MGEVKDGGGSTDHWIVRDDGTGSCETRRLRVETRRLLVETRQQLDNHLFGCNTPAKCALL